MNLTLPKPYLSWSSIECWRQNKYEFQRRYYENMRQSYASPEMLFGSEVGRLLENNDPTLTHIPRGTHPEYRIDTHLEGVPVLCFLDSFTPETKSIIEYKTSRVGWDKKRVDNHGQLLMYACAVREEFGGYDPLIHLVWLETEKVEVMDTTGPFHTPHDVVRLTGRVETFKRKVTDDELDTFEEELVETALEIEEDYTAWLSEIQDTDTWG